MKKLLLAILLSLNTFTVKANTSVNIVALVNGEVISNEDLQNRVNAFLMTTKIQETPQTKDMIRRKVFHNTVDEKIKLQDATKNGITVSEQEVSASVAGFEKNNNLKKGDLYNMLKSAKVSEETFRAQMKADMAWAKLIRRKMAGEAVITQKEVEQALSDAQKDLATPKYMVSEIFIKGKNARDLKGLVQKLKEDPRFELYAMQFSESPSASNGGNLGWTNKGKFLPPLEAALSRMKPGEISDPINVNGDFYILRLNNTFDPKKDKTPVPKEEDIRKWLENKRADEFATNHLQRLRQSAILEIRN